MGRGKDRAKGVGVKAVVAGRAVGVVRVADVARAADAVVMGAGVRVKEAAARVKADVARAKADAVRVKVDAVPGKAARVAVDSRRARSALMWHP
jgi:hypothetical protein